MNPSETGFLAAVVVVLVFGAALPFAAASPAENETQFAVDVDRSVAPPDVPDESGTATVDGETFDHLEAALAAADPGETVILDGTFEGSVTVETDNLTLTTSERGAVIDGGGKGTVVTVTGERVTLDGLWVRESGHDAGSEDTGVFVDGNETTLQNLHLTDVTYGVWVNGVDDVTITDGYIEGRDISPAVQRGNGVNLWETTGTTVTNTTITTVRDGIYYQWADEVYAANNTIADSRYGVHYMYSDDNTLVDNVAVDNDVGYALMVSSDILARNNTAVRNAGTSGHGILLKDIEDSRVEGNVLVENGNGLYVYNSQDNDLVANLVLRNDVGIHDTAGSDGQLVVGNSFIDNSQPAVTTTQSLHEWNGTDRGNYWSSARPVDVTNDGTSDVRYRPSGMVEHVVGENPQAEVFTGSPAFDAVRLAESSFPVIESPGIVDRRPLTDPPHDDWRSYADSS